MGGRGLRTVRGFSLVEVLVALALSAILLSSVSRAVLSLLHAAQLSSDRTELIERAKHTADFFAALARASAPTTSINPADVCREPSAHRSLGLVVTTARELPCMRLPDHKSDMAVLVVDTLEACNEVCDVDGLPSYFWLSPACHPLYQMSHPEIRVLASAVLPSECARTTEWFRWSRAVIYLRDYAWSAGDELGALMIKRRKPSGHFGRAERLVAGIEGWRITTTEGDMRAVDITWLFRGWRRWHLSGPQVGLSQWAQALVGQQGDNVLREEVRLMLTPPAPISTLAPI